MVTRTVVRILPEERAAAAVEEKTRTDGITERDDYSNDEHDIICDTIQLCSFQGCQRKVTAGGICDGHSYHDLFHGCKPNDGTSDDEDEESFGQNNTADKKRGLNCDASDTKNTKSRKIAQISIDLTDVPPQPPILRSRNRGGNSKYQGVTLHKTFNKWEARIFVNGKQRCIGYYDDEEEAAIDYARAVWKYRGGTQEHKRAIDLKDVPKQLPILKSNGRSGHSKYQGVSFQKGKWHSQIAINGKTHYIGLYDNEEEAAVDYARAFWKNRGEIPKPKRAIDLTDIPTQLPILKSNGKSGHSKYQGVSFQKGKWHSQIAINGKTHYIGLYDNEEEAAIDYARAVWKYRGETQKRKQPIDLTDVPTQQPILKTSGKGGSSKYQGVTLHKPSNKWMAQIGINGKHCNIGHYDSEKQVAVDYARAIFKYRVDKVERSKKKRKKLLDLTDVPPQAPILRCHDRGSSSKYQGVTFCKTRSKWKALIGIKGKQHYIGYYDNEEKAAIDYARALFKCRVDKVERMKEKRKKLLDLTDVPTQPPILNCHSRGGSSKYQGVSFDKANNKWRAMIGFNGATYAIGSYDNEEEAAVDYARASWKYRSENIQAEKLKAECLRKSSHTESVTNPPSLLSVSDKVSFPLELVNKDGRIGIYLPDERKSRIARFHAKRSTNVFKRRVDYDGVDKPKEVRRGGSKLLDLTDVPLQPPNLKTFQHSASKKRSPPKDDTGDNEKTKRREKAKKLIDLTDVPTQPPILRCHSRGCSSKYQGVTFDKAKNKWQVRIGIDGKQRCVGYYDNEDEAAIDYARAVRKYRPEKIQTGMLKGKSCQTESQHETVCNDAHKQKEPDTNPTPILSASDKVSFPLELVNKDGRIGIYLPDERKARIARFHAKRSARVFKRRVSYDVRKNLPTVGQGTRESLSGNRV